MIQQRNNLQLIQLLRGLASLLVVFLHVTTNVNDKLKTSFLFNWFSFGGAGVDIFFVLSGFIITYTSFNGIAHTKKFLPFIRRRFVRIFPTYWIIITDFLVIQLFFPAFYPTHYTFSVPNILSTYFLLPQHNMVNGVSWTLSFELFFYFLFSLTFIMPNKKWVYSFFILYGLIIILLPLSGYDFGNSNKWIVLVTFPMNVEFLMGVLSALIISWFPKKLSLPFIIAGSIVFIISAILTNNNYELVHSAFNRVILFGIPSFFIITGIAKFEFENEIKLKKIFLSLGEASYSLYLLHLPLVVACIKIVSKLGIENIFVLHLVLFLLITAICILSILFFKWLENPIIKKLNGLGNKPRSELRQEQYLMKK